MSNANNYVDATGLHTQTYNNIVTVLQNGIKTIYGPSVNLSTSSPDAQWINLLAQPISDTLDAIRQVYASFDPDQAVGVVLDQRCAINAVVRSGATYTLTNVTLTITANATLPGLDLFPSAPFTVQDQTGNLFFLVTTSVLAPGDQVCLFRAAVIGQIETIPNTITTVTTVTFGVGACNNPDSALYTGVNQETDVALRIRRAQSVAMPSQGYLPGLQGALQQLPGVINARVYENDQWEFDEYGIPPKSIWVIVEGGDSNEIANTIYIYRNAGCGMKGSVVVTITQVNGLPFNILYDLPVFENLWVSMAVESLDPTQPLDATAIKNLIYNNTTYGINEPADYTELTTLVKNAFPQAVVLQGGVGFNNVTFSPFIYPTSIAGIFALSLNRILITVV